MLLYHYCSIDKFVSIITSKVLWLSDLTKSNDTQEVIRTFQNLWIPIKERLLESDINPSIVKNEVEILKKQFKIEVVIDPPFGCCFCSFGDILQQWLEYGDKTRGVFLGFEIDWFSGLQNKMPHPNVHIENAIGYGSVLYHSKVEEDGLYKICYEAIKEFGLNAWIMSIRSTFKHYSAFIKNPAFFGEYESRIVYYPNSSHDYSNSLFDGVGLVTKPFNHYCLPWTKGNGNNALKIIGIGCNCNLTELYIQELLNNSGLSGQFEIYKSKCSYKLR